MTQETCLVTGGAGFIGSHLCERLLRDGYKVVCLDDMSTGQAHHLDECKKSRHFTFIRGDANDANDLASAFAQKPDFVFHYAALVGVQRTIDNPNKVLDDVNGINKIMELSRDAKVKRAIFASSSEVYGEPVELPEKEDGLVNPRMPYAVVKLYGEKRFKAAYDQYKVPTVSLRFFNVYGPRQDGTPYGFVTSIFIKQVLQGKRPTILGDGTATRDFVYIDDNIEAARLAMHNTNMVGQVINVGKGDRTTIKELAESVIKAAGMEGKLTPEYLPARPHDILHRTPDCTKIQKLLGFKPRTTLEEGLSKTLAWYKSRTTP